MQKLSQVNFTKIIILSLLILGVYEIIPDIFIQDQALKAVYKKVFLGIITVLYVGYTIFLFRKKGFSDVNNAAMCGILGFWAFYAWTQYVRNTQ
jgi:cbb3-type cytochrome oxidase subunit 3